MEGAIPMQPRNHLTPREVQVACLVWEGLTNREIGQQIGTTEQVVKNYLRVVFDKLGVWTRLELALYIVSHGGSNWPSAVPVEVEQPDRVMAHPAVNTR
jgi:DNA-binding NarL/FixJ family response regulator